jgi:hypothetical protein
MGILVARSFTRVLQNGRRLNAALAAASVKDHCFSACFSPVPIHLRALLAFLFIASSAAGVQAQSACTSDNVQPPSAILERFIAADCPDCWSKMPAATMKAGTTAIDWIVPRGDDAALSAAATEDANRRLRALAPRTPTVDGTLLSAVGMPSLGESSMRLARGVSVGDYVGTSMRWTGEVSPGSSAWLLLVEALPAGTESSPVARQLVRNALVVPLHGPRHGGGEIKVNEFRSMRFPDGANPERLQLVGWVQDAAGRVLVAAQTRCASPPAAKTRR